MRREIPQCDLSVVTFQTKHLTPAIQDWVSKAEVAVPMSCNRQIYFGLTQDFTDFPGRANKAIDIREGADAYKFMISLACGLESVRHREDSIKGQVFDSWGVYETGDTAKHKRLDRIMQDLKADTRFVGAVLADYKYHRHEIAARDLSGQQKGDTVLLVGSGSRHGNLSSFTDGIARVTGNKRSNMVSEIIVTHPDHETRQLVYGQLCLLKNRGILAAKVSKSSFFDFSETVERADRVYVDIPMGSAPQAEEHMILTWQTRIYQGNTLTHLRGAPELQGSSTPLWVEAKLEAYVSPEDIRADMGARYQHNKAVLQNAERAIEFCAAMRLKGDSPSHAKVRDHLAENLPAPEAL